MSEQQRDVRTAIIDRLLRHRAVNTAVLLQAPCIFCGYLGEGYWQPGTHHESCPVRRVGGVDREDVLLDLLADAQKPGE